MTSNLAPPDPVPVPNLPVMGLRLGSSGAYEQRLDNRIGLSSGADLRLSVCCRPGQCVRDDTALYCPGSVTAPVSEHK